MNKSKKILFLGGLNVRTNSYLQNLANSSVVPDKIILFGIDDVFKSGIYTTDNSVKYWNDLFIPNLNTSIGHFLRDKKIGFTLLNSKNINDDLVLKEISKIKEEIDLVIYSGYGGQIIKKPFFDFKFSILHAHSGWLPDFRGSTTLYYSWLIKNECAVTCLYLNEKIDEGEIVKRMKFPVPPEFLNIDYEYDNMIRGHLLSQVLIDIRKKHQLPVGIEQDESAETYFVIHPILKHLTMLKDRT